MPYYEITLLVKSLPKEQLVQLTKKCLLELLENGAVIRKLHNLGDRQLPFRITSNEQKHFNAHYWLLHLWMPKTAVNTVFKRFQADSDVIRSYFYEPRLDIPPPTYCTLEDELKPAVERQSVAQLRAGQKISKLTRRILGLKYLHSCKGEPKVQFVRQPKS